MYLAPRWIDRNLSRYELAVAVTLLLISIGVFFHYALVVYSHAERTMLEATATNIRTALRHRALASRLENRGRVMIDFERLNPMTDMRAEPRLPTGESTRELNLVGSVYAVVDTPPGYIGTFNGPPAIAPGKGAWYFDTLNRELVYTVINTEYFQTSLAGQKRVRFRIALSYEDRNGNGQFDPAVDRFHSVDFGSPDQFAWKI